MPVPILLIFSALFLVVFWRRVSRGVIDSIVGSSVQRTKKRDVRFLATCANCNMTFRRVTGLSTAQDYFCPTCAPVSSGRVFMVHPVVGTSSWSKDKDGEPETNWTVCCKPGLPIAGRSAIYADMLCCEECLALEKRMLAPKKKQE